MNMPSPITFPQWTTQPTYIPTQQDWDDTKIVLLVRDIEIGAEVLRRRLIEYKQQGGQNDNTNSQG